MYAALTRPLNLLPALPKTRGTCLYAEETRSYIRISRKLSDFVILAALRNSLLPGLLTFSSTCELLNFLSSSITGRPNRKSKQTLVEAEPACYVPVGQQAVGFHLFNQKYSTTMHSLFTDCRHNIKDYKRTPAGNVLHVQLRNVKRSLIDPFLHNVHVVLLPKSQRCSLNVPRASPTLASEETVCTHELLCCSTLVICDRDASLYLHDI